jgi:dihydroflavonol-4-reductase
VAAWTIAAAVRGKSGERYILAGHNLSYWAAWKQMAALVGKRGPMLPMGPLFRAASLPVLEMHRRLTRREGDANAATLMMGRQEHCFSSRKAEQDLGYRIRPLAETLADTMAWFRERNYVG